MLPVKNSLGPVVRNRANAPGNVARRYSRPLSRTGFIHAVNRTDSISLIASSPQAFPHHSPSEYMEHIQKSMLDQKVEYQNDLATKSAEVINHDPEVEDAISAYTCNDGSYILFHAAASGVEHFEDLGGENANANEFSKSLVKRFGNSMLGIIEEAGTLKDYFEQDVVVQADILKETTKNGPDISRCFLAKGVGGHAETSSDSLATTDVHALKFVSAVLDREPIKYSSFLSTAPSINGAEGHMTTFITGKSPSEPVINVSSDDGVTRQRKEDLKRKIMLRVADGSVHSFLLLMYCDKARGIAVHDHALQSEKGEVLLAPGHVFVPDTVVPYHDVTVITGRVTYMPRF